MIYQIVFSIYSTLSILSILFAIFFCKFYKKLSCQKTRAVLKYQLTEFYKITLQNRRHQEEDMKTITPKQIKRTNRRLIYNLIYEKRKISQQEISYTLHLSRPTVTSNLNELEETGLIYKNGQIDSDLIGRKAAAYSIVPDYRIGIGVEISRRVIKIMAIDLYGMKIDRIVVDYRYSNSEEYFENACLRIREFINSLHVSRERILGIGIAMQGLVSPDHTRMVYGKILDCTGLQIETFSKRLDYPCTFIHDAKSAAMCEQWFSPGLENAFFLHLSYHFGAAIIQNGEVVNGKHGHNSTVEHIVLEPDGPLCYCGKQGCAETFCSLRSLLRGEEEEDFFEAFEAGDPEKVARWQSMLNHLATLITSLHLVYDTDFILSGYLTAHMTEKDFQYLYDRIREQTPFEEESDFLTLGKMPKHSITVGAALPYIRRFLDALE